MLPSFVYGLAGKALIEVVKAVSKEIQQSRASVASKRPDTSVRRPTARIRSASNPPDPEKIITLVGRTCAGKSSLGNALAGRQAFAVGVEHGTTSRVDSVPFRAGYCLRDTPGLLDGDTYDRTVFDTATASELVVFVTTGQLYRQELDFLQRLCSFQTTWNRCRRSQRARSTWVFVNAADLKAHTMPSAVRAGELAALREQVCKWVPGDAVHVGAAAPEDGGSARIEALERHLNGFFACSSST